MRTRTTIELGGGLRSAPLRNTAARALRSLFSAHLEAGQNSVRRSGSAPLPPFRAADQRWLGRITRDLPVQAHGPRGRGHCCPSRPSGGLLRGFLSALGPIGCHPLRNRLLLFGRHRTALPRRRRGVGRGLRDRGGRSHRQLTITVRSWSRYSSSCCGRFMATTYL